MNLHLPQDFLWSILTLTTLVSMYLYLFFICIFLLTNYVEYLFVSLFAFFYFLWWNVFLKLFCSFSLGFYFLKLLSIRILWLYTLDMRLLFMCFANTFFHLIPYLCFPDIGLPDIDKQMFLILMKSNIKISWIKFYWKIFS